VSRKLKKRKGRKGRGGGGGGKGRGKIDRKRRRGASLERPKINAAADREQMFEKPDDEMMTHNTYTE